MALKTIGYAPRITWDNLPGKPTAFVPVAHTHTWSQITDTPTQFPPAAHTHAFSDITGKPSGYPPIGHMHMWSDITDKPATYPPDVHTHAWTEITGRPTAFPPSAHTHAIADIVGLQAALDGKSAVGHTHAWGDITGKPTTFPPAPHTHVIADVTGLQAALDGKAPVSHTHTIAQVTGLQAALDAKAAVGNAAPKPLGPVAPGTSTNASREDHVHPLPAGLTQFIGNVTVAEQTLVALGLGMKRMVLTLQGVVKDEALTFAPAGIPTVGCEAVNVYASAANQVTVSYFTPALGLLSSYSIPLSVFRITR